MNYVMISTIFVFYLFIFSFDMSFMYHIMILFQYACNCGEAKHSWACCFTSSTMTEFFLKLFLSAQFYQSIGDALMPRVRGLVCF